LKLEDAGVPLDCASDLRNTVREAAAVLRIMSAELARRRPAPAKWSPAEVIGHLIDSASNNHQRFVRAQLRADLRFEGYAQEAWVNVQRYGDAPWPDIVTLWESFNLHLARFMDAMPESVRTEPRADHNLDELAWESVPADEPITLEFFMRDYVAHLKHHLRQIDPALAAAPVLQRPDAVTRTTRPQ
jgi:hypothetical protein